MDNSELRNRKTPQKSNSMSKKPPDESDELNCKNERVQRLQSEEPTKEHFKNVTKSDQKDKVQNYFRSTIDSALQCIKTDIWINTEECFRIKVEFDFMTVTLFVVAFWTRIYKLSQPNNVV